MGFQRRLVENYRVRTDRSPSTGNRVANSITRIMLHNTDGWPSNNVEDLNPAYHFLVEPGTNLNGSAFAPGRFRGVALVNNWNAQVGHTLNHNSDSIGIAVAGNYHTGSLTVPPTNLFPAARAEVQRNLTQIVADCLVSFPRVQRINRVGLPTPVTLSGIMRHADVNPENRAFCPGVNLGVNEIIASAIPMANAFDALQNLRGRDTRFGIDSIVHGINVSSVSIARDANMLPGIAPSQNVGTLVARLSNFSILQNPRTVNDATDAIQIFVRAGLIPNNHVAAWNQRVPSNPPVALFLTNAARLLNLPNIPQP